MPLLHPASQPEHSAGQPVRDPERHDQPYWQPDTVAVYDIDPDRVTDPAGSDPDLDRVTDPAW